MSVLKKEKLDVFKTNGEHQFFSQWDKRSVQIYKSKYKRPIAETQFSHYLS